MTLKVSIIPFSKKSHFSKPILTKSPLPKAISAVFTLLLFSSIAAAQKTDFCQQASIITKTAEKYHYSPRALDDNFSELLFTEFLDFLDPHGLYFTQSEIAQLEKLKPSIDDEIKANNCSFLTSATQLYKKKLLFTDSLLTSFRTRKFNYNSYDTISFTKKCTYLNQRQLIDKWEKIIKLQVLSSYYANLDSSKINQKPSQEELTQLKEKMLNLEACKIKSKTNGSIEEYVGSVFLKSVATAFDPHTDYFTQTEEQTFLDMLSKEVNSFGLNITRNDFGEIEIEQLLPGSSAWNTNALNEGDVILKVKAAGVEKEFNCIAMSEVATFFNRADIKEAEFLVRKKNGKEITLTLLKSKVDVQENVIKSFILEGEKKIGYIYLPSFYSQMDKNNYMHNGCAGDVAKELIKLKNENITGLILDLRNDGGGSMMEAMLMSGIFIDYGAVSIIESRTEGTSTLKDVNRGTIYNAPLVILINNFSASASELFAAAMQDQNRAVIVGSNSFGKSTMQTIIPADAYKFNTLAEYTGTPTGYLKLTTGAFYRVTGKSHQKSGVVPDIKLPALYDDIKIGEIAYPSALNPTTIEKKCYYYPATPLPIQKLNELSMNRIKKDTVFISVGQSSKMMAKDQNKYSIPLNLVSFATFYKAKDANDIPLRESTFKVKSLSYTKGITDLTNSKKGIYKDNIALIRNDIYIDEAYNIINDLINFNSK